MHRLQKRLTPERIYEPNIIHNPFDWMGIWTPAGWRIHRKRWGKAQRITKHLSGDGKTTFFPEALLDPQTGKVEWQDDLHLNDDPFTDAGIYPSDPRVEYPIGNPRWAVSHTLLCYPVADHNLHTHEYTWDMTHGHLTTQFRKDVRLEEARTDSNDGKTVTVKNRPISRTIEGNVQYPLPNSAVRGVWADKSKSGKNYYTRRVVRVVNMHNGVYGISPHVPVVQCYGIWEVLPGDPVDELFDAETRECIDRERVMSQLRIPLDCPKIAMLRPVYKTVRSKLYDAEVSMLAQPEAAVDEAHLKKLRQRMGMRFEFGRVGYGAKNQINQDDIGYVGYDSNYDLNDDGVIDERDEELASKHLGRVVRYNLYMSGYFGGDWISVGSALLQPEHEMGVPVIADYAYGGGYDAESGTIHLLDTPGLNKTVYVEYFHDAPAEAGENNIRIHLYRESD